MRRTIVTVLMLAGLTACQVQEDPAVPMVTTSMSRVADAGIKGGSCTLANGKVVSTGFDEFGYNRCAHNFVGTYGGWCAQQGRPENCAGVPGDTRLNMKWNEEWDRGNATNWADGPYRAWLDNEIKGDDFSEHFKTKWDASCAAHNPVGEDGAPCIWGAFEILMDQGTEGGAHVWWTKLSPAGFGS